MLMNCMSITPPERASLVTALVTADSVLHHTLSTMHMPIKMEELKQAILAHRNITKSISPHFLALLPGINQHQELTSVLGDLAPLGALSKNDAKRFQLWARDAWDLPIMTEFLEATPTAELLPLSAGRQRFFSTKTPNCRYDPFPSCSPSLFFRSLPLFFLPLTS